ncbi:MAG: NAD(P)-binding domain-containing protein, partial [Candidatus Limnocylindrales bacterium]
MPGDDPERDRAETEAAIEAAGIDLHPVAPADHAHPHEHSEPGQPPVIGIVGAGAVGTALGVALSRAGWPVHAVASRDAARRERFCGLVKVNRAFVDPEALVEEVELIILAVPDDVIGPLASGLRMYGGQAMIHTSGAVGAEVLAPAMAAGTQIGSFHPLVAFA